MRSESAINETAKKYSAYCTAISMNILNNREDSDECVNDTYFKAWNLIPPHRPMIFSSFLGRITRNLSLDRYKMRKTQKRRGDETALLLSELEDCIPTALTVEEEIEAKFLEKAIDDFLSNAHEEERILFVRRYWFADSITCIAKRFSISESKVKTRLFRTRNKLKNYLEKEGVVI